MKSNTQKSESISRDSGELSIFKIWHTIQGEGPYSGFPAVFIRLAGCNITCQGCDTDYTSQRQAQTPDAIVQQVREIWSLAVQHYQRIPEMGELLVVITGGEPFRQNITRLVRGLRSVGYSVQIETNGTLPLSLGWVHDNGTMIVCSPKGSFVHPDIVATAAAFKYVLSAGQVGPDGLPNCVLGRKNSVFRPGAHSRTPIYIQPMDEQDPERNAANLAACVQSSLRFGYILGIQAHKLANIE